jgi:hypothetical protein
MRIIGVAVGRDASVVSRLLRAPDVAAKVAKERAGIHALEQHATKAVRAEATRERRKARRAPRPTPAAAPAPVPRPGARITQAPMSPGHARRYERGVTALPSLAYKDFLSREPAIFTKISVQWFGAHTSGTRGLRLHSDDPYDVQDVESVAALLVQEGCFPTLAAATNAIYRTRDGCTLIASKYTPAEMPVASVERADIIAEQRRERADIADHFPARAR